MSLKRPGFETSDLDGSTVAFSQTGIGTSPVSVPASPDKVIAEILIRNLKNKELLTSFDGGTTFFPIPKKSSLAWSAKGRITQVEFKTSSGTTDADVLINFEE